MRNSRENRAFKELYGRLTTDIFAFADALNFKPTFQQRQLLLSVQEARFGRDTSKIAVKSGQGPGKTTASGVAGMWLAFEAPYSKVLVTAPTMRQCRDVWLAEVKRILREADPAVARFFEVTGMGFGVFGQKNNEWGCIVQTATSPESAQGQHNKNMHIIFEEASGISRPLYEQYRGTLSNPGAVFLQIGNPNSRDSPFFDCFNSQRHKWKCFTWNAEDTPKSEWFDPTRNEDVAEEFGKESDVYRVRVQGEFPHADPNCVMSSDDLEKCMDKALLLPMSVMLHNNKRIRQFGIDFARFGGDESVIIRRQGNSVVEHFWRARVDPNDVVARSFKMQADAGWKDSEAAFVADAGGLGQGMMQHFYRAGKHVLEFHSQGSPSQQGYANKITQAWFNLGHRVRNTQCYLPKDRLLLQQLSTRQYYTNLKGKLILESKDEYMKRGFESPDRADGAVMAFYDGVPANGSVFTRDPQFRVAGSV